MILQPEVCIMMLTRNAALRVVLFLAAMCVATASHAERITVGGTGAAIALLQKLSTSFKERTGNQLDVLPSMGSGGALRAVGEGALDLAVSGRALKPEEIQKGLTVALTLRTPFVLATSHPAPQRMTAADLVKAYTDEKAVWPDGTPIRIILRPTAESDTQLMEALFPGFAEAHKAARKRADIPVAATDQDNADLAESTPASLTGTSYLQVVTEKRNLRFVTLDGIEPSLENFERGTYRYGKDLLFVVGPRKTPAIESFLTFLRSSEGTEEFRQAQMY
jgi:phosphate transport system substrate-binding protein